MYWPLSGRRNDNGAEVHNRAELRTIPMIKISLDSLMSGSIGHAIFPFAEWKLLNFMGNIVHIRDGQVTWCQSVVISNPHKSAFPLYSAFPRGTHFLVDSTHYLRIVKHLSRTWLLFINKLNMFKVAPIIYTISAEYILIIVCRGSECSPNICVTDICFSLQELHVYNIYVHTPITHTPHIKYSLFTYYYYQSHVTQKLALLYKRLSAPFIVDIV